MTLQFLFIAVDIFLPKHLNFLRKISHFGRGICHFGRGIDLKNSAEFDIFARGIPECLLTAYFPEFPLQSAKLLSQYYHCLRWPNLPCSSFFYVLHYFLMYEVYNHGYL